MSDSNPMLFPRPISAAMLAAAVASVAFALWQHGRARRRARRDEEDAAEAADF